MSMMRVAKSASSRGKVISRCTWSGSTQIASTTNGRDLRTVRKLSRSASMFSVSRRPLRPAAFSVKK